MIPHEVAFLQGRVKLDGSSKCIEIGHNSSNCGIDSTWQNYITHHVLTAAASSEQNSSVSCGQVKSKEVLYSDD